MQAVWIEHNGGPDVLHVREVPPPTPAAGEVLVDVEAVGVNFRDLYERRGGYGRPAPTIIGAEGAGTVVALGAGVHDFEVGDRICWLAGPGSYAEQVAVPAEAAVPVPQTVSTELAAAALLQGVTAQFLCTSTYPVAEGEWVVVHAAAGGVGRLLTQIVRLLGAHVLATASEAKVEHARSAGADLVVGYGELVDAAAEVTGGEGVAAVFDGVGAPTFADSLAVLRPRGTLVAFGAAAGMPAPVTIADLAPRSLYLTRPALPHYVATREVLLHRASAVFTWMSDGRLDVPIGARLPLQRAREAHELLESRRSSGKVLLTPPGHENAA